MGLQHHTVDELRTRRRQHRQADASHLPVVATTSSEESRCPTLIVLAADVSVLSSTSICFNQLLLLSMLGRNPDTDDQVLDGVVVNWSYNIDHFGWLISVYESIECCHYFRVSVTREVLSNRFSAICKRLFIIAVECWLAIIGLVARGRNSSLIVAPEVVF